MREVKAIRNICVLGGFLVLLMGCGSKPERNIGKLEKGGDDREQAIMELTMAKQDAVPPLIEALADTRRPSQVRVDIVEILFKIYVREKSEEIGRLLRGYLDDTDPLVREKVVIALGDIREEEAFDPLLERLQVEEDSAVRYALLGAVEGLGGVLLEPFMAGFGGGGRDAHIDLEAEQKEKLVEVLKGMAEADTSTRIREKAEDMLEVVAAEITSEADKLALKGDLTGAEEKYSEAGALAPESMNVRHRLGLFYYDNGWEQKGLEALDKLGLVARVGRLKTVPTIDGHLDDPVWQAMTPHTDFYQCIWKMRAYPVQGRSEAYVGYTSDALYIATKGYEEPSTSGMTANAKNRDGRVAMDDCVEIFLDTEYDHRTYYHIMVNSIGTIADSKVRDTNWNGDLQVATDVAGAFWTLEVKIPFKALETTAKKGIVWGFNIARVRVGNASEYGQWVPTYGSAHRSDRFGLMVFE